MKTGEPSPEIKLKKRSKERKLDSTEKLYLQKKKKKNRNLKGN